MDSVSRKSPPGERSPRRSAIARGILVEAPARPPIAAGPVVGIIVLGVEIEDYAEWRESYPNAAEGLYPGVGRWSTRGRPEVTDEEAEALAAEAEDMGPPESWPAWTDGHTYELGPAPADRG